MPSVDAGSDNESEMVRARLYAGELLAARGVYGIVWLDEELVVTNRYGSITDFITVGAPLTDSVLPAIGLEDDIKALKHSNGIIRLPNVTTVTAAGPGPRLTLLFYAFNATLPYVMIVAAAAAQSNLEMELSRQVRARLMAEAEAYAKSAELARANADLRVLNSNLEQFAAIVTHDLKAPMRAVRYLVDEIEQAIGAGDTAAARGKLLPELRRQTTRLSSMLSALLHYSSTGLSKEAIDSVDTRALVTEIVRSLPHEGIEVDIRGTWPTLETLVAPLDLTLRNLIDNTVKHHDRDHGRLMIACDDVGGAVEFTIEDDGPGIAPEHHASIFLPFRTLANGGEGMGLAIVQKMVDAAGGAISLTSNPAERRGTTFKIRWPKQIAL